MRYLLAKVMVTLACCVILTHAILPHHHHDCDGVAGLVFETEMTCQCQHDHDLCDCPDCSDGHRGHHSHHPFSKCQLADLLIVIKADEATTALSAGACGHLLFDLLVSIPTSESMQVSSAMRVNYLCRAGQPLPLPPDLGASGLRGPPTSCC